MPISGGESSPFRVLLVDDDPQEFALLKGLCSLITLRPWEPSWASDYDQGLSLLDAGGQDACLIDYRLGDERTGLQLLEEAKRAGVKIPLILLTGQWDTGVDIQAMKAGAADYLVKGQFGPDILERTLRYAIERAKTLEDLRAEVSERQRLEGMFLQAEKMSAMGVLAAGLAHEIKTPLSVLLNSIGRLKRRRGKDEDPETLRDMEEAAGRCRALVEDMLAFARRQEPVPGEFELQEAVSAALALVEPQAHLKSLEVERRLDVPGIRVRGHRNQIEQLVVNLATNAIDAMKEGGRLTVKVGRQGQDGPSARIEVADTGHGIPSEVRSRIFEPFFTTKGAGQGLGLGLVVVSEIVARHGGRIEVESAPGGGTLVAVTIPSL